MIRKIFPLFIIFLLSYISLGFSFTTEKISSDVNYLGLTIAKAYQEVSETTSTDGKVLIHLKYKTKTNSVYSSISKVENVYETFIDKESGYPLRSIIRANDKKSKDTVEVIYNHNNKTATYCDSIEVAILDSVHNFFSAFYSLRKKDLYNGQKIVFNLDVAGRSWQTVITVVGRDTVKINGEKWRAIILKATFTKKYRDGLKRLSKDIVSEGIEPKTKLKLYLSDDEQRIPIKMEYDLFPFSVKTELVKVVH